MLEQLVVVVFGLMGNASEPAKRERRLRVLLYALILAIGLVNVISYTDFSGRALADPYGDARNYIAMSQHTFAHVYNPFAFRLLSPLIVHEMMRIKGVGLNTAWFILTFLATNL